MAKRNVPGRARKGRAPRGDRPREPQDSPPPIASARATTVLRSRFLCAFLLVGTVAVIAGVAVWLDSDRQTPLQADLILAAYDSHHPPGRLSIQYPFDQAVFPPNCLPPTWRWEDHSGESDAWLVRTQFPDGEAAIAAECPTQQWRPSESQWQAIQRRSQASPAEVTVLGVRRTRQDRAHSSARISISTSSDEVGAPIFYREVNLPFGDAVTDPSRIRWRFGDITSRQPPPVVMSGLPVCGNCHSFSANGGTLGMDIDYANDKGSYAILPVREEMVLEPGKIITWSDYQREDGEKTFGLLSRISPDGKYVASTVKDGSVFIATPDLAFSQLFFPIKGILGIYSRDERTFRTLPGADDPRYVQSNPVWSPDGKWIVFARSKRYRMEGSGLLTSEQCQVFTHDGQTFLFDLYRVPFNDGRGGQAEPLAGASHNGMSNYFPRYSPDGKWIVFCRAKTFMLLQPDSELFIVPSSGGEARRLSCNTSRMNSWHSWSPNGKWMVFSSKAFSPYTQLFLTHFDGAGDFSPPVLLESFTDPDRAANIPEFVHADAGAIRRIREQFLDDHSFVLQGQTNLQFQDPERAETAYRQALALNPNNAQAMFSLATVLAGRGRAEEAVEWFRATLKVDPDSFESLLALGMQLMNLGRTDEAVTALDGAVQQRPEYSPARCYLGMALQRQGKFEQALAQYARALEADPDSAPALSLAAFLLATCPQRELRDYDAAIEKAERACELTQFKDPKFLATLGRVYAEAGRHPAAVQTSQQAVELARRSGQEELARQIERDFLEYWRQNPPQSK